MLNTTTKHAPRMVGVLFMGMCMSLTVQALPESDPVYVSQIKAQSNGSLLVTIDSTSFCNTDQFMIPRNWLGKTDLYAAALSSLLQAKKVKLEALTGKGCTGSGTPLQSITILSD